jgi:micrococcal nuclease
MSNLFLFLFLIFIGFLAIGKFFPTIFSLIFRGTQYDKKQRNILIVLSITFFILFSIFSNNEKTKKPQEGATAKNETAIKNIQEVQLENKNDTDEQVVEAQEEKSEQKDKVLFKVMKVVDGDTLDVDINGTIERIRLIGMDTPETVDPRKVVQCFGKEASDKAKEMLDGKMVRLEADNSQSEKDNYKRLLRYVYLKDGTFFNKYMIAEGYAHEYTYQSNPCKYQSEFKEAEKQARESAKGLWSFNSCNGNTTQAAIVKSTNDSSSSETVSSTTTTANSSTGSVVKKSKTGICHAPGTTYYNKTKSFTPYNSIDECLKSGGRLPKR